MIQIFWLNVMVCNEIQDMKVMELTKPQNMILYPSSDFIKYTHQLQCSRSHSQSLTLNQNGEHEVCLFCLTLGCIYEMVWLHIHSVVTS